MLTEGWDLSDGGSDIFRAGSEFLEHELPAAKSQTAGRDIVMKALWSKAGEIGWFRMLLPVDRGGLGFEMRDVAPLFAAVGRHAVPAPVVEQVVVLPMILSAVGGGPSRLEAALDGRSIVALADPTIDFQRSRWSLEPTVRDRRLIGGVDLVRFGKEAQELLVVAREARSGHRAVLLVSPDTPGITVESTASMDPTTSFATVLFDVPVAQVQVLIEGRESQALMRDVYASLRLSLGFELTGVAMKLGEMALEHARVRTQFGRPIGSFQAIKHLLADMAVTINGLRNLAQASIRGEDVASPITGAVLKSYASGSARAVALSALQVFGGIGFTTESDLHLYLKRAHSLQGAYGDERELAEAIGRHLLALGVDGMRDADFSTTGEIL